MKKVKWILGLFLVLALLAAAATAMADGEAQFVEPSEKNASDLVYTGSEIALINPGTTTLEHTKWQYSTTAPTGPWSDSVPTETDVQLTALTVYYQLLVVDQAIDVGETTYNPGDTVITGNISNVNLIKAAITKDNITWPTTSVPYTGSEPSAPTGGSVTGVPISDIDATTWYWVNTETTWDAGSYKAKATVTIQNEKTGNYTQSSYEITSDSSPLSITAIPLEITWTYGSGAWPTSAQTYDGDEHIIEATVAVASGSTYTGTLPTIQYSSTIPTNIKNKGTYSYSASLDQAETNFTLSNTTASVTINPYQLTYTWKVDGREREEFKFDYVPGATHTVTVSADIFSADSGVTVSPTGVPTTWTAGTHTITAELTGNTSGNYSEPPTKTKNVVINQISLENATIVLGQNEYPYSGNKIEPSVTSVTPASGGDAVASGEYSVRYTDNINASETAPTVTVTAVDGGNYTGSASKTFKIKPKDVKLAWSQAIQDQVYTGSGITPELKITDPDRAVDLILNTDYSVSYSANVNVADRPVVTVTGINNYGSEFGTTFRINPKEITSSMIAAISPQTYTGSGLTPALTITDTGRPTGEQELILNTDYTVTYTQNVYVSDTPVVTVTGINNYTGNPTTSFEIAPKSLQDNSISISGLVDSYPYTSNPIEPLPVVEDSNTTPKTLEKDKDYTVTYSGNHTNVSESEVTITITGQGNYKDSIANNKFTITPLALELTWTMDGDSAKRECVYDGAAHSIGVSSAQILDADKEKVTLSTSPASVTEAGTYTVTATKNGDDQTQNYTMPTKIDETFTVTPKPISENWVYHADQIYNGYPIETVTITDPDLSYQLVKDTDYSIVYSDDHTNVGEVTATITCLDGSNYTGNVEVKFNIVPKSIADPSIKIADLADEVYTTKEIKPTLTVTDTAREDAELVLDQDYTVTYAKNVNQGIATVTITGINNYKDENGTTFVITRKPVKPITVTMNGPTEDTKRLGGPDASKYHTITIDAEADKTFGKMTVTITKEGADVTTIKDVYAGDITIEKDAINGAALDGSGDVTYTVTALYDDADNLTTDAESTRESKPAPEASDKFNYDTTAKAITVKPLYNRAAKGVGVALPEGYRLVKFTSTGAGTDFVATNAASLAAGDHIIPFNVGENPKLNSTAKGGSFTGEYEDYVGNKGTVDTQEILKARGTIEIVSVEPPINDSGRIGYTPSLTFTVKMSADGGFAELASGGVFGSRTLTQGEQLITVSSSSLAADTTNTPSLAFEDLEGSATFRSFIYDPVCDQPVLTIEPYAGAYYLMGLAEPYSSIVMEVNGEKVTGSADAFGVFALKLPLTEEGDMISLKVTDLAGNIALASYRVGPESEDVNSTAFMAGRVLTNAHSPNVTKLGWTMVLTANVDDLKAGKVNVPILAANMVSVGTMSVKMDANDNLSYSYVLDDGVQVQSEKFIANTKLDKEAFIAQIGIEVSPSGTLITDIQKGRVYLSCKMSVSVPAEKMKTTFQTEKIKDSEMKKLYRDIQNGKLN